MGYIKIYITILIISILFSFSNCFSFLVNDNYEKYCFYKYLVGHSNILLTFVVISYPKELISADLFYKEDKYSTKKTLYQVVDKESDYYKLDDIKEEGYYEICFYSKKGKEFHVSMEFDSYIEERNVKKLATDKEIKSINKDIKEVKDALHKIEINAKHINNRNFEHYVILHSMISSIKNATYLKIFFVVLMSGFQIYIITKFFGKEKRISTIKGTFNDKGSVL